MHMIVHVYLYVRMCTCIPVCMLTLSGIDELNITLYLNYTFCDIFLKKSLSWALCVALLAQ